jgi:hypothetical protein
MDSAFIARLEQILHLYALAYDEHYPVFCFDERPCFLIGDSVAGLEMKAGQVARQHYAYEKKGSCVLLMAIEPKTAKRVARVSDRRTKLDYAHFMRELAARYPKAKKIRFVTAIRVLLYAEERQLVEHDRDRVLGFVKAVP